MTTGVGLTVGDSVSTAVVTASGTDVRTIEHPSVLFTAPDGAGRFRAGVAELNRAVRGREEDGRVFDRPHVGSGSGHHRCGNRIADGESDSGGHERSLLAQFEGVRHRTMCTVCRLPRSNGYTGRCCASGAREYLLTAGG